MNSHSYVAKPRKKNVATKVKENHCESKENGAIDALLMEVAACALNAEK